MAEYRVKFEIDIDADSPEHAAQLVTDIITDQSDAGQLWQYEVTNSKTGKMRKVTVFYSLGTINIFRD